MELERALEEEKKNGEKQAGNAGNSDSYMNIPCMTNVVEDLKEMLLPAVEASELDVEVIPTPPLVSEEPTRHNLRNAQSKLGRVEEKAVEGEKRNLEGLLKGVDKEQLERGAKLLKINAVNMLRICEKAHVNPAV